MRTTRRRFLAGLGLGALALGGGVLYKVHEYRRRKLAGTRFEGRAARLSELPRDHVHDVCIIGSGMAGAVLGIDLASRGLDVLILEAGDAFENFGKDPRYGRISLARSVGEIEYPIQASRIMALGGTTNIWTGRCARLHPIDFARNAYTPAETGWPFGYDEFAPWYRRAEKTLNVRGGPLSKYHAPRTEPLPPDESQSIEGLRQLPSPLGITVDPSPTSHSAHGGPVRAAGDLLPRFVALRSATLASGAMVTRLVADASGTIRHAEVRDPDRTLRQIRARRFVVAAGAVESARLLLLSRSDSFAEGLGNAGGHVGRWFTEHPNLNFSGRIEHTLETLSPQYEIGRSHQFYDDFKQRGLGSMILVLMQSWIYPEDLRLKDLSRIASRLVQAELHMSTTLEMKPDPNNRVRLSDSARDLFGNPVAEIDIRFTEDDLRTQEAARRTVMDIFDRLGASGVEEHELSWSHHHIGTCRFSETPEQGVVDARLRVHGCRNLYVLGSSVFVTGGASHPTLAITALAHRLADHLLGG